MGRMKTFLLGMLVAGFVAVLLAQVPALRNLGVAGAAENPDPRVELVELQVSQDLSAALAKAEVVLETDPLGAAALGIPYLRGHLLSELGMDQPAARVFEQAITASPHLAAHARFRLAEWQLETGNANAALVHLVDLLTSKPPKDRVGPALDLVELAVSEGADCSLLSKLSKLRLGKSSKRRLDLSRGICAGKAGDDAGERQIILRLLAADTGDDVALHAARQLAEGLGLHGNANATRALDSAGAELLFRVGLSYHHHREFELAIPLLERAFAAEQEAQKAGEARSLSTSELYDCRYALARSQFWLGRYRIAAKLFESLAADTAQAKSKARALYQRARCFELIGRESWPMASRAFAEARDADPKGGYSGPSTIARLRLAWLSGREQEALQELDTLIRARKASEASRALVFLASSDLVAGRADRAGTWLAKAERYRRLEEQEVAYWKGREAEVAARSAAAVDAYLRAWVEDPHHPFGVGAARRLGSERLASAAEVEARSRASSSRLDHLHGAWLVLGDDDPDGQRARDELLRRLRADARAKPFIDLAPVPAEQWPLWNASLVKPDERLLALGVFEEGGSRVLRHFPVAQADLAYTGGLVLARAGATRRSLYIAEILGKRIPEALPAGLLPESYRQLLHPFRYSFLVLRESGRRDVDPYLLAAIIREESRYDPDAFSAASARGLTQFVYPTARQIAERIELGSIEARDIHRPEVAIALGAGYLAQLAEEFDDQVEHMVAAYNAGEPQARLWRAYATGGEPEEYLSKVAFRETRNYLRKVLRSRAHYRELYERGDGRSAELGGSSAEVPPGPERVMVTFEPPKAGPSSEE